jgi:hypothetical protein
MKRGLSKCLRKESNQHHIKASELTGTSIKKYGNQSGQLIQTSNLIYNHSSRASREETQPTIPTLTFCLSGTGMHFGSGYGYGTVLGSGFNIKCNKTVRNQKREANFLGLKLLLTLKRQYFV